MRVMCSEWDLFFVESGEEALQKLSQNKIDVIVADMRMPGMDGAELFGIVRDYHPHVIRIILSGQAGLENSLRLTEVAHQYLAKPCHASAIKDCIERFFMLERKFVKNVEIRKAINGIQNLPSLPGLYNIIVEELESPKVSLKKIGEIIAQDMVMCAKVLQLVNSAFFGLPQEEALPCQAVSFLGLKIIEELFLSKQIFFAPEGEPGFNSLYLNELWKHSVAVGEVAREIALGETTDLKVADEAYVAGLLHDIGKIVLLEIPEYSSRFRRHIYKKQCSPLTAEYELLGVTHAGVGGYLLGLWNAPDRIVEAVAFHHCPEKSAGKHFSLLTCVHVANSLLGPGGISNESICEDSRFPRCLDIQYIKKLNLESRLESWFECCRKVKNRGAHQPECLF